MALDRVEWLRQRAGRPIPVFERDASIGSRLVEKNRAISHLSTLLLLHSATFDPVAEGEPDYSAFVPSRVKSRAGPGATSYYLVQLKDRILPRQRAELQAAGARVLQYIPHNAYVVRMAPDAAERVRALASVRWQGPFRPGYKVHSRLMREAAGLDPPSGGRESRIQVMALLFPNEDALEVEAEVRSLGLDPKEVIPDLVDAVLDIEIPRSRLLAAVRDLSSIEAISWLEIKPQYRPQNDHSIWVGQAYDTQNGPTEAGSLEYPISGTVWKRDILGTGEIIAVADSGLDRDACQFRDVDSCPEPAQAVPAPGALFVDPRRKVIAYNVLPRAESGDHSTCGGLLHGTHTAGSAAGDSLSRPSTVGVAGHDPGDGMAPQAKLLIEDVANSRSCLFVGVPSRLFDLWTQEKRAGASIATNSWGPDCDDRPCGSYDTDSKMNDRFVWENPDFLILFSSGNAGQSTADGSTTHADKNIMTIGGSSGGSGADRATSLAPFSSRGPAADGRYKPDLTAPATNIVSAGGSTDPPTCLAPSCSTTSASGTSMACPTAAGFAALVRQYYREGWYPTGRKTPANLRVPSAALLKATLLNGAMNMTGSGSGGDAPNDDQGWGRIHLDNALYFNDAFGADARKLRVWDVPVSSGLATAEMDEYRLNIETGQPLKLTLVWTDPPAAPFSGQALVNNLDLEVVGPGGTYSGNIWNDPTPSTPDNNKQSALNPIEKDDLNNVESVLLLAPASGTYTIRVKADSVPGAGTFVDVPGDPTLMRQGYALVVTGGIDNTAGSVAFSSRSYPCGSSSVSVDLFDEDAGSSTTASVTNSATGDTETLTLVGAAPFLSGSLPLEFNVPAVLGDGRLQVGDSSTLTVTYADTITARAKASVGSCAPAVAIQTSQFSGGCDHDGYLDANETAGLTVTLRNMTVNPLTHLVGRLTTSTQGVIVGTDELDFGVAPPGALVSTPLPYMVSALSAAPGTPARFDLSLTADGFPQATTLSFSTILEQDPVFLTNQTVTFNMDSGVGSNISPPCAASQASLWTTFASSSGPFAQSAIISTCDPSPPSSPRVLAMSSTPYSTCGSFPSSCGDYSDEKSLRARSPWIGLTPPGSTFVSATPKNLAYRFRMDLPTDSSAKDTFYAWLVDPQFNFAFLGDSWMDKDSFKNTNTWQSASIDLTRQDLESLIDRSRLSIEFGVDSQDEGSNSTGMVLIDEVALTFDAQGRKDDSSTCTLPCTSPAAPQGFAASNPPGVVHLEWSYAGGVGEYHVYRGISGCAGPWTMVGEVSGQTVSFNDAAAAPGVTYAYQLRAADPSGACESSGSQCVLITPETGTCRSSPSFGGASDARSNDVGSCGISVLFGAGASSCGGNLTYNIFRSTTGSFEPGPGNLIATGVSSGPYVDSQVSSLTRYCYIVRAVDGYGNEDGNQTVRCATSSGPRTAGAFIDNAEIPGTFTLAPPWTRTTNQNHEVGGARSYWSNAGAPTSLYPDLTCGAATSPEIELMPTGQSLLSFWTRYNLEYQWDGMVVEVATEGGDFDDWTSVSGSGFYSSNFAQTGRCAFESHCPGLTYCNVCCYPPVQGAFNGPDGNQGLTGWSHPAADLSAFDGRTIKVRFNFSTDPGIEFEGIYVDEISLTNVALPSACTPGTCTIPPIFYGLVSATDLDPYGDTGVRLAWNRPVTWGSGGSGSILIYRDGILIATLPGTTTTYDDLVGINGISHIYQAVARSNCGLRDGNGITRSVTDCAVSDAAVDATDLRLSVEDGKIRLVWSPIPGATVSRVHWAAIPNLSASCGEGSALGGSVADAYAPMTTFDHDVFSDGLDYFYTITGTSGGLCPERRGTTCP